VVGDRQPPVPRRLVAGQDPLRASRPVVRAVRLVAEHQHLAGEAQPAQLRRGGEAGRAGTDDEDAVAASETHQATRPRRRPPPPAGWPSGSTVRGTVWPGITIEVASRLSTTARAGQAWAARITSSLFSAGTDGRYVSRPSARSRNTSGASCSQKPNRTQRPGSTFTSISRLRSRVVSLSVAARGMALMKRVTARRGMTVDAQATTTEPHTSGGPVSEP